MIHSLLKLDWSNISIQEYIDLQSLLLDNEEGLEQEDLIMREIQILYDRNPYAMSLPEFKKCVDGLKFL